MKIDKYYALGFGIWILSIIFVGLFMTVISNNVQLRFIVSMIISFILWVIVMKWISIKQRKNWRNL